MNLPVAESLPILCDSLLEVLLVPSPDLGTCFAATACPLGITQALRVSFFSSKSVCQHWLYLTVLVTVVPPVGLGVGFGAGFGGSFSAIYNAPPLFKVYKLMIAIIGIS